MRKIEHLIAGTLRIDVERVTDELTYQSIPEWDSIRHVELILALEREIGARIDNDLTVQLNTVGAIRKYAASQVSRKTPASPVPVLSEMGGSPKIHRGLDGVYFDKSSITSIDGRNGELEYCGYSIHDLVEQSSFEETIYLLLNGGLPDAHALDAFKVKLSSHRELPSPVLDLLRSLSTVHPIEALRTGVSALGAITSKGKDESLEEALEAGVRLIGQVPAIIATHHAMRCGRDPVAPEREFSHAENFLFMLFAKAPQTKAITLIDKDLIVHADHGANASTFAARIAIGCKASIHAAITAAIATFSGSLHGGAAGRVVDLIDSVGKPENAATYVRRCLDNNLPIMGFGHRVYRTEDPRVRHLRMAAEQLSREVGDMRGMEIIEAVVEAMEPYARHGIGPNVDLYAGLTYRLLGIPDDLAVSIFVAGRIAGWIAQAMEQKKNNVLIRSLLHYAGPKGRKYSE